MPRTHYGIALMMILAACTPAEPSGSVSPPPIPPLPTQPGELALDFQRCQPETRRVDVTFGSTTYEIIGAEAGFCLMNYGGEVENPDWDGVLDTHCRIPQEVGALALTTNDMGVDFTPLASYCERE